MLTRRKLLGSTAGGLAAACMLHSTRVLEAAPAAATELGKVKIVDVKTAPLNLRYPVHLVKVITDAGLNGIGEAYNRAGVISHIDAIKHQVIGQDPLQVDYLYQRMCEAGVDFPLGVDLHWRFNTRDSMRFVQMAEHLNLWFLEDPMPPENAEAFARLTAASKVAIATGENLYTRQSFRPFIEKQACDIIQPDAQKCGGLLEMKKIADWADLYYMNMLCHNTRSPVGSIASGRAWMAIRSFLALESDSVEIPYWADIIQQRRTNLPRWLPGSG